MVLKYNLKELSVFDRFVPFICFANAIKCARHAFDTNA